MLYDIIINTLYEVFKYYIVYIVMSRDFLYYICKIQVKPIELPIKYMLNFFI